MGRRDRAGGDRANAVKPQLLPSAPHREGEQRATSTSLPRRHAPSAAPATLSPASPASTRGPSVWQARQQQQLQQATGAPRRTRELYDSHSGTVSQTHWNTGPANRNQGGHSRSSHGQAGHVHTQPQGYVPGSPHNQSQGFLPWHSEHWDISATSDKDRETLRHAYNAYMNERLRRTSPSYGFTAHLHLYLVNSYIPQIMSTPLQKHLQEQGRARLADFVLQTVPEAQLHTFGSMVNGLALDGSDIDLCLVLPDLPETAEIPEKPEEPKRLDSHEGMEKAEEIEEVEEAAELERIEKSEEPEEPKEDLQISEEVQTAQGTDKEEEIARSVELEKPGESNNFGELEDSTEGTTSNDQVSVDAPHPAGSHEPTAKKQAAPPPPPPTNPVQSSSPSTPRDVLEHLGRVIRKRVPQLYVQYKTRARVPIIKVLPRYKCGGRLNPWNTFVADISVGNALAIRNSYLVRAYTKVDERVRLLILFIKHWAGRRKVNEAYHGTLSSYGWALMAIHYLMNVVHPPILPNLQKLERPETLNDKNYVDGYDTYFFSPPSLENDPIRALGRYFLPLNPSSLAQLIMGFFEYYAKTFDYKNAVVSVRDTGVTKEQKGWTEDLARDHNYLCIEDPFKTDYNVGRVVQHPGFYTIQVELERACEILQHGALYGSDPAFTLAVLLEARQGGLLRPPGKDATTEAVEVQDLTAQLSALRARGELELNEAEFPPLG